MINSLKYFSDKLDTYAILLSIKNGDSLLREIRELKYDLYSYMLEIANGKDVVFCNDKVDGILKRLRFLGCEGFVDKFKSTF